MSVFTPPKGTGSSSLFFGAVYGILAFIGFEGAATMGEEAREPRRSIPRAIFGTVVIAGIFYVFTASIEVMGFGTSRSGMTRFQGSSSLFGSLGSSYLTPWIGDVVTVGTMVSAFAGAIGCVVGASRLIYAMARAAQGRQTSAPPTGLLRISGRFGTPVGAIAVSFVAMTISVIAFGWVFHQTIFNAWAWTGAVGTLIVLVAYILATAGAARMLRQTRTIPARELAIPVITLAVLGYTIFRNVYPYPTGPTYWLPIVSAIWVVVAVAAIIAMPAAAHRIGTELASQDGLVASGAAPVPVPASDVSGPG
jgi:amino acid transporter